MTPITPIPDDPQKGLYKVFRFYGEPKVAFLAPGDEGEMIVCSSLQAIDLGHHVDAISLMLGKPPMAKEEKAAFVRILAATAMRATECAEGKPRARSYPVGLGTLSPCTVYADAKGLWLSDWKTRRIMRSSWQDFPSFIPTGCQEKMSITEGAIEPGCPTLNSLANLFSLGTNLGAAGGRLFAAHTALLHAPSVTSPGVVGVGDYGTGKSSLARVAQAVFESYSDKMNKPNVTALKNPQDLWAHGRHYATICCDNQGKTLSEDILNAMCRIILGDMSTERQFHTNSDLHLSQLERPVYFTSLEPPRAAADFYDRFLVFPFRQWEGKMDEQEFTDTVNAMLPKLRRECMEIGMEVESMYYTAKLPKIMLEGWRLTVWLRAMAVAYRMMSLPETQLLDDMTLALQARIAEKGSASPFVQYLLVVARAYADSWDDEASDGAVKVDKVLNGICVTARADTWVHAVTKRAREIEGHGVRGLPTNETEFGTAISQNNEELQKYGMIVSESKVVRNKGGRRRVRSITIIDEGEETHLDTPPL